jgi:hypothetical protein
MMPIRKTGNKYYWGSKGPFDSRKKAEEVAQAAHASGYEGSLDKAHEVHEEPNAPVAGGLPASEHHLYGGSTGPLSTHWAVEDDVNVEKIIPVVGAALGAVGRLAAGAVRGAGGAGKGKGGMPGMGGMPGISDIIPDEVSDPSAQTPHQEEEWNQALHRQEMQNALLKEGDSGGAFNGLSGTVFTSSHAGIFTPNFGERGTRRRHRKNKRNQDAQRKKLMGEDKKNGLDRLVQFLQEGSPRLHKRQPDKMMTGQFQSIHADKQTPLKQIDWRKRQKGVSKVEDHPSRAGDTSSLAQSATYPGENSSVNTGTKPIPAKTDWGMRRTTVQKAEIPKVFAETIPYNYEPGRYEEHPGQDPRHVPPATTQEGGINVPKESHETFPGPKETHQLEQEPNLQNDIEKAGTGGLHGIGPLTNQNTRNANGIHPQDTFLMVDSDDDKKQQVVDQNDFENRVKEYDNKEDEKGNIDQPRAAGATKGMMDYPNSNMQMMEKSGGGSGIDIHQDDLHRGGELDEEDVEIDDEKDDAKDWIPEDETKVKAEKEWLDKFQLLHKTLAKGGNATPVLSALLALDNE